MKEALLGGILIGLASSFMFGAIGRISGISGFLGSVLAKPKKDLWWRYFFFLGLITGGLAFKIYDPSFFSYHLNASYLTVILAGLVVGFGTTMGSGCTSGHGVCGLARLSKRSIVATLTFILWGMLTVFIKGFFL